MYKVESCATQDAFMAYFRHEIRLSDVREAILRADPLLESCLRALPGLRVLRPQDPEEVLFCFLCTPNNNIERITRMVRTLESYGEPFAGVEGISQFPSAERIAAISEEELRAKGFGYRARTIPFAAKELLGRGEGWLDSLKGIEYREAHQELCQVPGIGPKLADCICLFGLHFLEAVPVDTHLWQAACRAYFPEWKDASLTARRYREIGNFLRAKFDGLAGWAHQFMFLENMLRFRRGRRV